MKKLLFFGFIFILFFGCKKYENDSSIHIRTITKRLCGTWKDVTYPDIYTFIFKKDGSVSLRANFQGVYSQSGQNFEEFNGSWAFSPDKRSVKCNFGSFSDEYFIARLDYKDLWFGKTTYVKYKKQ